MRVEEGFQFPALASANRWHADAAFRAVIVRHLSSESNLSASEVSRCIGELQSFGDRCKGYQAISSTLEGPSSEPRLIQYDAWGKRVDRLITSSGWKELKGIAAKEAIVGESYGGEGTSGGGRSKLGAYARIFAFAKIIIFGPVSKVVLCPVSMSDGAVRVLELYGTQAQKDFAIPRLLSTDPNQNWTAGQWMTERPGGSDVSRTETTATPVESHKTSKGDEFILNGFKWFSSATDGDIALALARTDASLLDSSKGLSLFLIKIRNEKSGQLNGIRIHRLKNKMGTKYLPTAELELDGCVGELVGELGRGVATISSVLNITRLYSASGALAGLGHGLQIATAYAQSRQVMQSKHLSDLPLHTATLLQVTILYRALLQLFFHNSLLIGKVESGTATPEEALQSRFLTPALKAFCATRASEGYIILIESLGGQGYMEENGLAEGLRDLTVERIWEGTASVMSLDVLRVIVQSKGVALTNFIADNLTALKQLPVRLQDAAKNSIDLLVHSVHEIGECMSHLDMQNLETESDYRIGRPLLECIMTTLAGVLLLQQAAWRLDSRDQKVKRAGQVNVDEATVMEDVEAARLWIEGGHGDLNRNLSNLKSFSSSSRSSSASLSQRLVYSSMSSLRSSL